MKRTWLVALLSGSFLGVASLGWGAEFPLDAKFDTIATFENTIEGLTLRNGYLFTASVGDPCPVFRIDPGPPKVIQQVGQITAPCFPLGMAFNSAGKLFIANAAQGTIVKLMPNVGSPPTADSFATVAPAINGLAFDADDNLYVSDGTAARGIVWKITPTGDVTELFRIQPMRNGTNLGGLIDNGLVGPEGVGRRILDVPPEEEQGIVANGLAFTDYGTLVVSDTARGALWEVEFGLGGAVISETGCDQTFTENTLCLNNVLVAHPCLEGADGIVLDTQGNIVVDANERNAVCVVQTYGTVIEIARNNPHPSTGLRNRGPLEFNSSPVILGRTFCTANFDRDRRDNFPATGGKLDPAGANRGNIVCMKEELPFPGLPLPVQ